MAMKKMRYTKALYEDTLKRAVAAEYQQEQLLRTQEQDYEPRPPNNIGDYGQHMFGRLEKRPSWQEKFLAEKVVTESWMLRTKLAESAHRAMAEALREMGGGASSAAVICEWAGRGMQDKPEPPRDA
jgi:hypothetical protein